MAGLRRKMESGELDMGSMMMQALNGFATSNKASAKTARRLRIKRLIREKYPELTTELHQDDEQEEAILTRLAQARKFASMVDFSDEDSDEDSGEEHEGDEDDEWEDDENSVAGSES